MPLLGKKLFDSGLATSEGDAEEFIIPHSKEVFHIQSEYEERMKLYEKQIWTCQCTGHLNLTHKEATLSEKACRERLSREFALVWEEPVLKLVHHSFSPLDNIIAHAYHTLMTELIPGEKVLFTVAKHGKSFDAVIVRRYEVNTGDSGCESSNEKSSSKEGGTNPSTTSPPSRKEKGSRQALITDIFQSDARRSPRITGSVVKNDTSGKGKRLRLISAKYDIHLINENKIVSRVPNEHLTRMEKPPSREQIRLFIRANSVRPYGSKEKLPWIVDETMVFRYSLKPRIATEEEKRMLQGATITEKQYFKELNSSDAIHSQMNGHACLNGDSDINVDKAILIEDDKPSSPDSKIAPIFCASKRKTKSDSFINGGAKKRKVEYVFVSPDSKSTLNMSLNKKKQSGIDIFMKKYGDSTGNSSKKTANKQKSLDSKRKSKHSMKSKSVKNGTPTKCRSSVVIDLDELQVSDRLASKKDERQPGSSRKNASPKKKKQATLLELTKKGNIKLMSSRTTPSKSRDLVKPRKPRQPLIVIQLLSLKKEKNFRPHKYKMTVTAACKLLTKKQRDSLPDEVRDDILKKWELEESKRKFQAMSPEERRAFLAEQRKAKREAGGFLLNKKLNRFEDQCIVKAGNAKGLPEIDLVVLPETLPNTTFGDIAMLCEFLHSYHILLSPKDGSFHKQFNVRTITEAVTRGKNGYRLTGKILVLFLQTLLADDIARDYTEVEFHLNQILVTPEISCEMIRICLRQHDEEPDDVKSETSSNADIVDIGLSDSTARRLFEMELYEMEPVEQVEVLSTLAYRVMNTYAVQMYMEDTMLKATTLWNKVAQQKKAKKQELKEKGIAEPPKRRGPKPKETKPVAVEEAKIEELPKEKKETPENLEDIDLVSRVKRRKMLSEQNRKEEEERKRKLREEQDKLAEEQRNRQEWEKADRQLLETRMLARHVKRRIPLGTDRNHSRYWLFCDGIPGLYIEKGWVDDYINYTTMPEADQDPPSSPLKSKQASKNLQQFSEEASNSTGKITASSDDEDNVPLSQLSNSPKKTAAASKKLKDEATWPRPGQNLWLAIDSKEVLDSLMASLCQNGVRESKLHHSLEKNYDSIIRSLNKKAALFQQSSEPPTRRSAWMSDGDDLHITMAKKHLKTLVREAGRGGIANIDDLDVFEQRIDTLENVSEYCTVLLEFHATIPSKFLKHYMTGVSDKKNKRGEQTEADTSDREKTKAEHRVAKWRRAVEETALYSRFCLLLAILNSSIKWELYQYRRQNARRTAARNKNYADINEGMGEEEEEEEEAEEEEEDDASCRRSSRIRKVVRKGPEPQEILPEKRKRKQTNYRTTYSDEEQEGTDNEGSDCDAEVASSSAEGDDKNSESEQESEEEEIDETTLCKNIIDKLLRYRYSEIFRDPVNGDEVSDYYDIVTHPICLSDIRKKIDESANDEVGSTEGDEGNSYTFDNMTDDVKLLLDNAALYNTEDSYVMKQANKLEQAFVRMCREHFFEPAQNRRLRSLFKGVPR